MKTLRLEGNDEDRHPQRCEHLRRSADGIVVDRELGAGELAPAGFDQSWFAAVAPAA